MDRSDTSAVIDHHCPACGQGLYLRWGDEWKPVTLEMWRENTWDRPHLYIRGGKVVRSCLMCGLPELEVEDEEGVL